MNGLPSALIVLVLVTGSVATASGNRPLTDMNGLTSALKIFKIHAGRYPTQDEGLAALIERPSSYPGGKRWMRIMDQLPLDPWGRPYEYVVSAALPYRNRLPQGFGLYSKGTDGISRSAGNDPDDWNTWTEDGRGRMTAGRYAQEHPKTILAVVASLMAVAALVIPRFSRRSSPDHHPA